MLRIAILALGLLLSSCAANPTPSLTPLAPYSAVANGLVWLEDQCEDPLEDALTLTPLEATADMLALPLTMAMWTLRLAAYWTVGVGMVIAGKSSQATIQQINWVLPMPWAGPNPDRVGYGPVMVRQDGCL